jgi:hypothetical protein
MRQRGLLSLNKNLLPALIGVLSIFSIPQLSAASQLSRGWVYIDLNKPACVDRARAAASVERLPNLQITADYIFWTSPGILGAVHCLTVTSARTVAFIVVYADDNPQASRLRDLMFDYMQSGVIEGRMGKARRCDPKWCGKSD